MRDGPDAAGGGMAEPCGDLALAIKARADSFSHPEFLTGGRALEPPRVATHSHPHRDRPRGWWLQASERSEMGRVVRKGNEAL